MAKDRSNLCIQKDLIKGNGKTVNFKAVDRLFIKMEHNIKEIFKMAKNMAKVN
jgi:hypothetical protein